MIRGKAHTVAMALLASLMMVSGASAQSLSVDQLKAKIDARTNSLNQYQSLLNDPDPARAVAAMQIMMGSGDPELFRIARDFGIYSPNSTVQQVALDSFFRAKPVLVLVLDASKLDKQDIGRFDQQIVGGGGTVTPDHVGTLTVKVGPYDDDQSCFVGNNSKDCFIRMSNNIVSMSVYRAWATLTLNKQGALEGFARVTYVGASVPLSVPIVR